MTVRGDRRWRGRRTRDGARGSRARLAALLLAAGVLVTLDVQGGDDSPLDPARVTIGEVLGPAEVAAASVTRPLSAVPSWFRSQRDLRAEVAELDAENAELRGELTTVDYDRSRLYQLDRLTRAARDRGVELVPARVVGYGPRQSFQQTVTIDAGTRAGLHADMTVLNGDGLVGRVLRATSRTSTVLLIVDGDSVVGGRVGSSLEMGFLRGRGGTGDDGLIDLALMDATIIPAANDTVVTWGSEGRAPYVPGIPVGRIVDAVSSPRQTSQRAVVAPFVDFSALDVVGVVVPAGSESDRSLVGADGSVE